MRTARSRQGPGVRLLAVLAAAATTGALLAPASPGAAETGAPDRGIVATPRAGASKAPVYRDPVGYRGVRKVPPTRAVLGPSVTLSTGGTFPHTYVDEAGTAHIVWNEDRGDAADVTVYCRLERGGSACDQRAELTWSKTYGPGDGPQFNTDSDGPRILRIGDQLLVLSFRYPTLSNKPDGGLSSSTVVGWLSNDGGESWSDAVMLGWTRLGQVVVAGPEDDPVVLNVGEDPFCPPPESSGQICLSSMRSAGYDPTEATLNPDGRTDYFPTVVPDGQTAVMAMGDSVSLEGAEIRVRRWNGHDPVTDPANWTMSGPITGAQPELASGPAGVHLLQSAVGTHRPLQVRSLSTGADGIMSAGPPHRVAPEADDRHELVEDSAGRLHALFANVGRTRLEVTSTGPGESHFGPATVVTTGADIAQHDLSVTDDGGGFVVANTSGGVTGTGRIVARAFGSLAPTGKPGLGDLPGGGNVSCTRVGFGSFDLQTLAGCFFKGTGGHKGVVVTRNGVGLNGLEIVPTPGSTLVIDPEKLTIDTVGQARVLLRNGDATVELFKGRIARNLAGLRPGDRLFEFPPELFRANVLGFPVSSGTPVELTADGVRVPVDLKLPAAMGGFTGHAALLGHTGEGLDLDSLHIAMGPISFGVASFRAQVDWTSDTSWSGSGTITVPAGGRFKAQVAFEHGDFISADFDYDPEPPIPVLPLVYLTSVGGGLSLEPATEIRARATLGAPQAVAGVYPVLAYGNATMTLPDGAPAHFRLDGSIQVFMVQIAHGYFEFFTDGYAQFHGATDLDLGPLQGGAQVNGFVDPVKGRFGADVSGDLEICLSVCGSVSGAAAISSLGFAFCADLDPPGPGSFSGGLASSWADFDPAALADPLALAVEVVGDVRIPCHTSDYRIPPPRAAHARTARAAAPGGSSFAIPGGLPTATLLVPGVGGTPEVRVVGPDGTVLTGPGGNADGVRVVTYDGADAVWVLLPHPSAGDYTVSAVPGSVALGTVKLSEGYRAAKVRGRLLAQQHGHPGVRRLGYRITHLGAGQSVQFRERGRFGTRVLGTVRQAGKGTFRFHPRPLRGRKRTVEAVLLHRGLPQAVVPLGRYRAPAPGRPGPVHRLRVHRKGSRLSIGFRPARHTVRTVVRVHGDAGSRYLRTLIGKRHTLRLDGFRWDRHIAVTVVGYSVDARPGKSRTVRIRPRHHAHD